ARWGLGVGFPVHVSAMGGHFMFEDDQETPNTLHATFCFGGDGPKRKMMELEVRHWITNHEVEIGTGAYGGSSVPPAGLNAQQTKAEKKTTEQTTPKATAQAGATAAQAAAASLGPKDAKTNTVGNVVFGSKGYPAIGGQDA